MKKEQFVGHWVAWPYSFSDSRSEQILHEDGRFEAKIIDDTLGIGCSAKGKWDVIDGAIQWTYESARKVKKPRRPHLDKVLLLEDNRFVLSEGNGAMTATYWRGVPCDDTSANFDLDEVQPLLEKMPRYIDNGFTESEIADLMDKVRKLPVKNRLQVVFPVRFQGVASPFYIGVFMDDTEAPDICFSGPIELIRNIEHELEDET